MSQIAERIDVDPRRAVLVVQDMQNDVIMEGGAWADSGAPEHAKEQNVVDNVQRLAEACRAAGIPVIHVHYIVEEGARGLKSRRPAVSSAARGARRRPRDWSRRKVTSSSRRCA